MTLSMRWTGLVLERFLLTIPLVNVIVRSVAAQPTPITIFGAKSRSLCPSDYPSNR
jgi:hypothetical protein